ncbi:hypothetical protein CVT25_011915 [Psilocybe cyanescens]|uniref:Uncharacterized protein n=1 Tax=Psilocybe cyanescens TaxID=93625 RepID=A0A409XQF7_PSICY|nr:hypothetical protein CVT25_011915 [Psilocybe cyanescens]
MITYRQADNVYTVQVFDDTAPAVLPDKIVAFRAQGNAFTPPSSSSSSECTSNPLNMNRNSNTPLPNLRYLATQAAIAGIQHTSGAGNFFDKLLAHYENHWELAREDQSRLIIKATYFTIDFFSNISEHVLVEHSTTSYGRNHPSPTPLQCTRPSTLPGLVAFRIRLAGDVLITLAITFRSVAPLWPSTQDSGIAPGPAVPFPAATPTLIFFVRAKTKCACTSRYSIIDSGFNLSNKA